MQVHRFRSILTFLVSWCLIVTVHACSGEHRTDRPETIHEFLELGQRPRVIAHRGFSGVAPENSLASFRKAIEIDADMIELDVLLSRDGQVVVIHDDAVDRTTNGSGRVSDFTLPQLLQLDVGSWYSEDFAGEKIPTLAEVLELVDSQILLNVEIKQEAVHDRVRGGITEKVVHMVNQRSMRDRVIISSFDPRAVRRVQLVDPEMKAAMLYNDDLQKDMTVEDIMNATGADAFNLSSEQVTRGIVEEWHSYGLPVSVYTVNDVEEMEKLIAIGVNAIFTDRPDRMLELRR